AGGGEYADHAGTRVRCTANHLHRRTAVAGVDHADPQTIRVGVLIGRNYARDGERRQRLRFVGDAFDLEPDHGELVSELFNGLVGVEMLLQPREGELHDATLSSAKISTRRKRSHISIMSSL